MNHVDFIVVLYRVIILAVGVFEVFWLPDRKMVLELQEDSLGRRSGSNLTTPTSRCDFLSTYLFIMSIEIWLYNMHINGHRI